MIELRAAFEWTCECCGRDTFQRAIAVEFESLTPDELVKFEELGVIISPDNGTMYMQPTHVKCPYCGSEFEAE